MATCRTSYSVGPCLFGQSFVPSLEVYAAASNVPMSKLHRRNREQMQLNRLLAKLPCLQQEFPDPADFWPAFAGLADLIVDAAGPDDLDWIACQINAMLEAHGLLVR